MKWENSQRKPEQSTNMEIPMTAVQWPVTTFRHSRNVNFPSVKRNPTTPHVANLYLTSNYIDDPLRLTLNDPEFPATSGNDRTSPIALI